jgi:hypothetical protein
MLDGPTLRVVFVGDPDRQTTSPELLEIHRQYEQPDPLAGLQAYAEELRELDNLGNWPRREDIPEIRTRIASDWLGSEEGRLNFASTMIMPLIRRRFAPTDGFGAMINPIRQRIDYQSVGRRTFLVEQLPNSVLPIWDREPTSEEDPSKLTPEWVQPGQWVYAAKRDVYAVITEVVDRRGFHAVRVQNWRHHIEEDVVIFTQFLEHWQPCARPPEPRTAWEKLCLEDDPFEV